MKNILITVLLSMISFASLSSDFITTESGLSYKVLEQGSGKNPKSSDTVKVHYIGRTETGFIFDDSTKRGKPAKFRLNQVIKGWTEGLQYMNVGSVYKFVIPPQLGYGKNGIKGIVGANDNMVFVVQLISIE